MITLSLLLSDGPVAVLVLTRTELMSGDSTVLRRRYPTELTIERQLGSGAFSSSAKTDSVFYPLTHPTKIFV